MALGDHLSVRHGLYTHHGIDMGDGTVIHYGRGLSDIENAKVEIVSFETFSHGKTVQVVESLVTFDNDEIVERAKSRLGENSYDVFDNNCEHFAHWCRNGHATSHQASLTKTLLRQTTSIASRPFFGTVVRNVARRHSLALPLLIADAIQTGAELAAIKHGKSNEESEQIGYRAGAAASIGVGLATAGPVGAATGLGIWMTSQIIARRLVSQGQEMLCNP